ncbi:hypothetical protein IHE45_04G126800 [Dioscorea alata]|uniref:Uncharacterized protein n=1 Tax=Dioscorea alata TaxID=55571 RepID=A0ACB7WG14_DIOAL|nr:hypothetical protein IHE45_04G126800 [Dioscorea alata]
MAALVGAGSVIPAMKNYFFFKGHSTKDESGSDETLLKKRGERQTEVEKKERGSALAPRFSLELDGLHCFETLIFHMFYICKVWVLSSKLCLLIHFRMFVVFIKE